MRFSKLLAARGFSCWLRMRRWRKRRPTRMSAERRRKRKFRPGTSPSGLTARVCRRARNREGRRADFCREVRRVPRRRRKGGKIGPRVVGGIADTETLTTLKPVRTVGGYWPYATSVWDFIHRAMPRDQSGTLTPNEVYALTAFILFKSNIIQEGDVLDAEDVAESSNAQSQRICPAEICGHSGRTQARLQAGHLPLNIVAADFSRC